LFELGPNGEICWGFIFFIMIQIPVSVGELIDKLSILRIKQSKIKDVEKLRHVNREAAKLNELAAPFLTNPEIAAIFKQLTTVNKILWTTEDKLRKCEKKQSFRGVFIENARRVYYTNDIRFALKDQINKLVDSEIVEVKDYTNYK